MKSVLTFLVLSLVLPIRASAQQHIELIDTTSYYAFSINYWFNMHHLLWTEAFLNTKADSSIIEAGLDDTDIAAVDAAVRYYKDHLVDQDLRTSDYMSAFKAWITDEESDLHNVPDAFTGHMEVLRAFDETYKANFWTEHKATSEQALAEYLPLIRATEDSFVKRITKLTRQFWQFDPQQVKVDLSYFGKSTTRTFSSNPYTTLFPTHVVMRTSDYQKNPGTWLELLYHESAHHLILGSTYFVAGTIRDLAEVENIERLPRQLGHAYLFYLTGQITKDLLAEQGIDYPVMYMKREGLFARYFPLLERHLTPYIERRITLAEATRRFLTDFSNRD